MIIGLIQIFFFLKLIIIFCLRRHPGPLTTYVHICISCFLVMINFKRLLYEIEVVEQINCRFKSVEKTSGVFSLTDLRFSQFHRKDAI